MNRQPEVYTAFQIAQWDVLTKSNDDYIWRPARPEGCNLRPFSWRWKVAWKVLIGKYDALDWQARV